MINDKQIKKIKRKKKTPKNNPPPKKKTKRTNKDKPPKQTHLHRPNITKFKVNVCIMN